MKLKKNLCLLLLSLATLGCADDKKMVVVSGNVIDAATDTIVLLKPFQDLRFDEVIEIPVTNGRFEQRLDIKEPEGYYLMLGESRNNGGGRYMPLILEEGNLNLTIYPEDAFDKNVIDGGDLSKEYLDYREELESQGFEDYKDKQAWTRNYILQNSNLVSYFLVLQDLTSGWEIQDLQPYQESYARLSAAFPEHSYNEIVSTLLEGHLSKIGKRYIDFSAPDLEGNEVKLSDQIEGKVALINLWATWCGPCIRKSREIIPVVERYSDKGFTVVGVAGEFKSTDNLERFLEKDEFPWLNLVELDRKNAIWAKYGIPRSGGGMFLVDRNGEILMKDPTAEELEQELAVLLK